MIADLPGSLEARKKLVTTALVYLDGLAAEQSDDVALQNELSEAYLRIGQAQGYGSKANLGDRDAAMASFEKALAIRVAALAAHPDSTKTLDGICIIRNHIANLKLAKRLRRGPRRLQAGLGGSEATSSAPAGGHSPATSGGGLASVDRQYLSRSGRPGRCRRQREREGEQRRGRRGRGRVSRRCRGSDRRCWTSA